MSDTTGDGLRTLLVGIDGASPEILAACGETVAPNCTELIDAGASGALQSQIPPWTPSAWPSIYTGVNPGKHGVFGFLRFTGYDWDVVNFTDIGEHAVWELLSQRGYTSVVVNAPVTHPPTAFDGALVPGYVAPESPECHPPGLLDELESELGEYRIYDDATSGTDRPTGRKDDVEGGHSDATGGNDDATGGKDDATNGNGDTTNGNDDATGTDDDAAHRIEAYERLVASRGDAFRYLVDRFDPDFGFLQFQQTDTVFHEAPGEDAVVDAVYAAVDREIGATLEACDPDVVVLVSDHGMGPYDGHEFRANSFLRDRGDVVTTAGEGGMPSWSSIARNRLQAGDGETTGTGAAGSDDTAPTLLERSLSAAARAGVTSQRIQTVVRKLGIEEQVLAIAPPDAVRAAAEHVDFERSRAYVRDRIELGVRINLEGREPAGVVHPDEYESLRTELIDALAAVRTPGGEPVFESVVRRETIYDGPYVEDAPDVVVVPNEFDQFLSASLRDDQFGQPAEPWNHKREGIVAIAGDVDDSASLPDAHVFDVAPTILATFGVPASDRMDGEALPVTERAGAETYPAYESSDATTDDAAVERRLAELGYLDR